MPGFGHPVHRPLDPRAERILELADARGVSGPHVLLARCLRDAVAEAWGKPLTMNVSMPIAAVMLDLGFPAAAVKAVPILARTAGLLAHLAEEQQQPLGFLMAGKAEEAIEYEPPAAGRLMLAPEVETRPWAEQLAARRRVLSHPARLPLRSLGLLSREARARRGSPPPRRQAGSRTSRSSRSPRSTRSGRRARPDNPIGAHLCATPSEIVRIYSTSGTTGAPSYIPLTAGDLDNWVTGVGAQLRGVRHRRRPAHRHHLQRRAVRRRRGARRLRPHRPLPHPGRHREHRAADAARSSSCGPRPRCSRRRMPTTSSNGRRSATVDLRGVERRARPRGGRARRRRAGVPREARGGLGREGHRGDGHRRHRRVAVGRVRGAGRHAPGRARLRPRRADRPRDRRRARDRTTAPPASSC